MRRACFALLVAALFTGCGGGRGAGRSQAREPLPPPHMPLVRSADEPFRATPPATSDPGALTLPEVVESTLDNGLTLWVAPRPELPLVAVVLANRAFSSLDPASPPGVAALTARVIERELERASALDPDGESRSRPRLRVSDDGALLYAEVPSRSLGRALRQLASVVLSPTCDPRDIELVRVGMREDAAATTGTVSGFARFDMTRMLYGSADRRSAPWYGSREFVEGATAAHCQWQRSRAFVAGASALVIAGDVTPEQARAATLEAFGPWGGAMPQIDLPTPTFPASVPRAHLVPTGSSQAGIRLMERGPGPSEPGHAAFVVLARILGGMFVSHLNVVLREERGYSYGVVSELYVMRDHSVLELATVVSAEHIVPSVAEVLSELQRLGSSPSALSPDEVWTARAIERAELAHGIETTGGVAMTLAALYRRGLTVQWLAEQDSALAQVDAAALVESARAWLRADAAPLMVTGNPSLIGEALGRFMPGQIAIVSP